MILGGKARSMASCGIPSGGYQISFTTTKNGIVFFDLMKSGDIPFWVTGDGNTYDVVDFSHTYNGRTYDGGALYADLGTLTAIDCNDNSLIALDVSANTSIAALDVSANTDLATLLCHTNELTVLDVSTNTSLIVLQCYANLLTSLDVSNNTALETLLCRDNLLNTTAVDQVLADVEAYGTSNGTLVIDGTNDPPSAVGLVDKAILEGRGWTVIVTDSLPNWDWSKASNSAQLELLF